MKLPDRVILFDGICAVCDAGMTWILDHDPDGVFHFAPLQGEVGQAVLARHPELPAHLDSIVFVEQTHAGERVSWHTAALIDVAKHLPAPWSWMRLLWWVPWPLRDAGYQLFAAVRYRIFGTIEACRIPKEGEAERFLA